MELAILFAWLVCGIVAGFIASPAVLVVAPERYLASCSARSASSSRVFSRRTNPRPSSSKELQP